MTRLRYRADLEPLPRTWFDDTTGLLHDTLAEYLGSPDLPLVDGFALRPGSRYASADRAVQATVESWSKDGETRVELNTTDADLEMTCLARLDSASAPRTVGLDGGTRTTTRGTGWLTETTGSLRADLELWWTGTARPGGVAAIAGWVRLSLLHGRFEVTPAPGPGGRWQVTLTARLRGRGVLRPLTAVALAFARGKIKRRFVAALDVAVERWNREVPAIVAMPPDQLRELITAELGTATRGNS